MSAFLCSDLHTVVCALAASRMGTDKRTPKALYSALRSLNNASLAIRYGDAPVRASGFADVLPKAEAFLNSATCADVLALLTCLNYQCEEGSNMATHKEAQTLKKALLEASNITAKGHHTSDLWSI